MVGLANAESAAAMLTAALCSARLWLDDSSNGDFMGKKTLYLVDGSGLIFRAYFAIRHLNNSGGHPTNATYGFTQMLHKLLKDYEPTHIVVALDTKEKTFRHKMYDQYKANRPEPPEDLIPQFEDIRNVIDAHNIVRLELPGFEADDVIATLADRAVKGGFDRVVVVTSDKDLCQIVSEKVTLLDTKKDTVTDIDAVKERFGTDPAGVVDSLALSGDSSDNIPGIPGIGEKTAKKLLEQFGSMEGIYQNIEQLKGKQKENIEQNRDLAALSRSLVVIRKDVPLDINLDEFALRQPDKQALSDLYSKFEFRTLLADLDRPKIEIDRSAYQMVITKQKLSDLIEILSRAKAFAVDTETTSTQPMRADLVGISFCCDDKLSYYIPIGHQCLDAKKQLDAKTVLEAVTPVLQSDSIVKIAHNLKYDYMVLKNAGLEMKGPFFDTMLASYVLDPGRFSHSLDALALELLGHKCISYKEVAGKGKDAVTFDLVLLDAALDYAAEDAHITWLFHQLLCAMLDENKLRPLFKDIEMPLLFVLADMEENGVKIDVDIFSRLHDEYLKKLKALETKIHDLAGHQFNLNSPKQVGQVLFEEIGLKPVKKTKTGPSTDVTVLEVLAEKHDIPRKLLEYRQVYKLVSTYIDTLPGLIYQKTGRIHCSFNQTVAATGRLSSSEPNLQNIPVRTEDGRRIREGFIPEQGNLLLSADYSQIELRIMAHMSGDRAMISHFNEGRDIHQHTAAEVFGVMPALVSKEQRFSAKAINFGILYGISAFRLGKDLQIGTRKAQEFIDTYFDRYPDVKNFLEGCLDFAREKGYVETMFGRRRKLPQINSKDRRARSFSERMAYNTPIQGSAADLIKLAMIRLFEKIKKESLPLKMIVQVHDELVFEASKSDADEMTKIVIEQMENVHKLKVPLLLDAHTGKNWAEIH